MSKAVGDDLRGEVRRAWFSDVEINQPAGTPPVDNWLTLMPCSTDEGFFEEEIAKVGLDGRRHVQYYAQKLSLIYHQVDSDTLEDLYGSYKNALFSGGVETRITLSSGQSIELTMYWSRRLEWGGPRTVAGVRLTAMSTSLTSAFA